MSAFFGQALLASALIAFVLEACSPFFFGRARGGKTPRPTYSLAALGGLLALAASGVSPGPLIGIVLGGIVLFGFTLKTDYSLPSSRRHFIGTILGGVLLFFAGQRIGYVGLPGFGNTSLMWLPSLLLTVGWVFLVVSMVEICSLLPMLTSLLALVLGAAVLMPVEVYQTASGQALGGVLAGGVIGRFIGSAMRGRSRPLEKTDTLVLGYLAAAATLSLFLKSATLAGLILPLALLVIFVVVLVLQSFERSIMLRTSPRE